MMLREISSGTISGWWPSQSGWPLRGAPQHWLPSCMTKACTWSMQGNARLSLPGEASYSLLACLFIYLTVCLPACLPAGLPACRPACLPACLPSCLPACLPVYAIMSTDYRQVSTCQTTPHLCSGSPTFCYFICKSNVPWTYLHGLQ